MYMVLKLFKCRSFGGLMNLESRKKFDMFFRELEGQFPSKDTVFEYAVDQQKLSWVPWETQIPGWRYSPTDSFSKIVIPTIPLISYDFLVRSLITQTPVLVTGEHGAGKTTVIQHIINNLKESHGNINISLTSGTTSQKLQKIIESKLEKRTKNIYGPIGDKPIIAFVDDLNLPQPNKFGSQPTLELLKHWLEYETIFDCQKQIPKIITDVHVVAALGPPGV
jgi:dynein heavy chain